MKLKAFGIFCLPFLVMSTLSSCDNENLVNEEELDATTTALLRR